MVHFATLILKVPIEAIHNIDEKQAINVISKTFNKTENVTMTNPAVFNYHLNSNPVGKMVELNKWMLQKQKEMIEKLKRLIDIK